MGLAFSLILGLRQIGIFRVWVRMELNMLLFVALLSIAKANLEIEGIKYFIVQRIGSRVFLVRVVLGRLYVSHRFLERLIGLSLVLKLGIAPAHSWFIRVIRGLSWEFLALASTAQKVLPVYLFRLTGFDLIRYVLMVRVGARVLGRINQLETKKLLAYSSIFRAVWLLRCGASFSISIQYLSVYALALLVIIGPLFTERRLNINEVLVKSLKRKICIYFIGFFRIAGSPPFLGFYAKVIVAQVLLANGQLIFLIYLVRGSVFLLYVYMRFFYQAVTAGRLDTETRRSGYFYRSSLALVLIGLMVFPWV
jgi:NADH-quinone oxidoreductase subunit N